MNITEINIIIDNRSAYKYQYINNNLGILFLPPKTPGGQSNEKKPTYLNFRLWEVIRVSHWIQTLVIIYKQ